MGGTWGKKITYSIFGESHGPAIGITIDGLTSGLEIDIEKVKTEMKRRAPGQSELTTSRVEGDEFEILSGFFNRRTTGTPLTCIIRNTSQHSKDYDQLKDVLRPGHADYSGRVRYSNFNDYRGSGHFSGRITAPLVFAGAIAKQILLKKGILVGSHILTIGNNKDTCFDPLSISEDLIKQLAAKAFPVIDEEISSTMKASILKAKGEGDSLGGIIEAVIINIPPGIGDPFFDSLESTIAHLMFSVPAVKGLEFGRGFEITKLKGSEANDSIYIDKGTIKTRTNNNGGIIGGITNGMPVVFKVALKPAASIEKEQNTINYTTMEDTKLIVKGRHDACILQRAVPVVESVAAIAVLELID
ncbi:MAG TPA: chorismate synthase [Clostridiaceae bacterium]